MNNFLLDIDKFQGMSKIIEKEDLPPYVLQEIKNLYLTEKAGALVKRSGYKNILTSGLTNLKGMIEFKDQNDNRQILIQDGTGLEESVYSAGYGAIAAIANDERTSGSTVDQIYPVKFRKEIRSGAGLNASTDKPLWFGYIPERIRFSESDVPVTVSGNKYLENQFYKDNISDLVSNVELFAWLGYKTGQSLDSGNYAVYIVPVIDGYQKSIPQLISKQFLGTVRGLTYENVYLDNSTHKALEIGISTTTDLQASKRITHFDIFIAPDIEGFSTDQKIYPAYFLERVSLINDGDYIFEEEGTFEDTDPPTYIEFTKDFADWETFKLSLFHAHFTHNSVDYHNQFGLTRSENGTKVRYDFGAALASALQNETVTIKVRPGWDLSGSTRTIRLVYDNYYKKLGSEMYSYLGIPIGDQGVDDLRYKYSEIAGKRLLICGLPDKYKGYYSAINAPDIIPALNDLNFKEEPTGCTSIGNDHIVFSKKHMERISIYGNQNAQHDHDFLSRGITNQKALLKISDSLIIGYDYAGPWMLRDRYLDEEFGNDMKEYWDALSDAYKDACKITYDILNRKIIFSFSVSSQMYVFDLRAHEYSRKTGLTLYPWVLVTSDTYIQSSTIAEDNHLLTGSATKIVDWNNSSSDENVSTSLLIKLLKSPVAGKSKTHFDRIYLTKEVDDSDTFSIYIYEDGSDVATDLSSELTADDNVFIRRLLNTMELELTTAGNQYDYKVSRIQITGRYRNF